MSEDFFKTFDGDSTKTAAAATPAMTRKAPPPPPAPPAMNRSAAAPSSLAAAAASTSSATKSGPAKPYQAGVAAAAMGRPVSATGPRPSGTNAPAATTSRPARHQLQQTRPVGSRATATSRSSTHISSPGDSGPVSRPSSAGFYPPQQQQQQAPASTTRQPTPSQQPQSFQPPAVFHPQQHPNASASINTATTTGAASTTHQFPAQPAATQTQGYAPYSQQQPQQQPTSSYGMSMTQTNDFTGWMNTAAPEAFSGAMDSGGTQTGSGYDSGAASTTTGPTPTYFTPQLTTTNLTSGAAYYNSSDDFLDEPPLLEELGINMDHILFKTKAVVLPFARLPFIKTSSSSVIHDSSSDTSSIIIKDADLAGPLVFALLLGAELLVTGKLHSFGYIYGLSVFGCGCLALILNLMKGPLGHAYDHHDAQLHKQQPPTASLSISMWTTTSILGYSLLPVNVLAGIKILFAIMLLQHNATAQRILQVLGFGTVLWSTMASTRLLEVGCDMRAQRYLIAYPIALLYSAFVLVTIF